MYSSSFIIDWSNLTADILHLIIHKLNLIDFLRFSATCHSYHFCAKTHRRHCRTCPKTIAPWLLLPSPPTGHHLKFHDFFSQITHNVTNQNSISCVGSSNGFLITTTQSHDVNIINPLTKTCYPLPCNLHIIDNVYYNDPDQLGGNNIFKAVVNMDDYNQRPEMAVVMYLDRRDMAFAKPNAKSWVDLYSNYINRIDDILFHKGKLYAVYRYGAFVFNIDSPCAGPIDIGSPDKTERLGEESNCLCKFGKAGMNYLIESPDRENLFVVIRRCKPSTRNIEGRMVKETIGFDVCVLKFTDGQESWEKIESLGGLAMFVGHSSLCFVPWSDDVKKNCIYFIDDLNNGDVGEFDFMNKRIKWLWSPVDRYQTSHARAFWFKPSLL